jgi:DNA-binding GntR family transcriptional regulator
MLMDGRFDYMFGHMNKQIENIFNHLLKEMVDGILKPKELLPIEKRLAEEFGTDINTVYIIHASHEALRY